MVIAIQICLHIFAIDQMFIVLYFIFFPCVFYCRILMAKACEIFQKYSPALVELLPMTDDDFIHKLKENNLLSDEIIETLKTLNGRNGRNEKASYFLDNVIKLKINEDNIPFDNLLSVMEECQREEVKGLALRIKADYNMCTLICV